MKNPDNMNERISNMTFATIYSCYLKKVEKKGRTQKELNQIIEWLTGFDEKKIDEIINENLNFKAFFEKATLNPNAHLIQGTICGIRVEEIENPLTQKVRYLDKLVDELAQGKPLEKIFRLKS